MGRNRGQIEDNTDTQGNKQNRKMKNKKNHKKSENNFYSKAKIFRKNFLKRQRSGWE